MRRKRGAGGHTELVCWVAGHDAHAEKHFGRLGLEGAFPCIRGFHFGQGLLQGMNVLWPLLGHQCPLSIHEAVPNFEVILPVHPAEVTAAREVPVPHHRLPDDEALAVHLGGITIAELLAGFDVTSGGDPSFLPSSALTRCEHWVLT